jgi:hypothetical protein
VSQKQTVEALVLVKWVAFHIKQHGVWPKTKKKRGLQKFIYSTEGDRDTV